MIREIDVENLTNEKATAIARMMGEEQGPVLTASEALKQFGEPAQLTPEVYEDILKEQQKRKKSFTMSDYLEMRDPSEKYKPFWVGGKLVQTDAFERELMKRNLIVRGPNSVECSAFFSNTSNRTLFPEFVNRNILAGKLLGNNRVTVEQLIADSIEIDGSIYQNLTADFGDDDLHQATIGEGARFPEISLTLGEKEIQLQKFGGKVKGTYEFFRRVRANQLALTLQMIGLQWANDQADAAVDVILNGNTGNSNPAINTNTAVAGTMDYADLVRWMLAGKFPKNLLIVSELRAGDIILMDEFKDSNLFNFQATGTMITPFGRETRISDATALGDDLIAGIDPSAALIKVMERGSSITETQKIMDGQFNEILFSQYIGFAKLFEDASQTLTITP